MSTATRPVIATPEQWRAKRVELLAKEKELSRVRDELSRERRELPWVPVEEEYVFQTIEGDRTLAGALRAPEPAPRLPLHVRAGLGRGVPELLVLDGQLRRDAGASRTPRRRARRREPRPARPAPGLPRADGLGVPVGLVAREPVQLRLRRVVHRGRAPRRGRVQLRLHGPPRRRAAGRERVRQGRGRRRLPHLLLVLPRAGRAEHLLPAARPRAQGSRRSWICRTRRRGFAATTRTRTRRGAP